MATKADHAFTAFTASVGIWLLSTWQVPSQAMMGVTAVGFSELLRRRNRASYVETYRGAWGYFSQTSDELGALTLPFENAAKQKLVHYLDSSDSPLLKAVGTVLNSSGAADDTAWFTQFIRRSGGICAGSGSGKTHILKWALKDYIQNYPSGQIIICDCDYGSSHEGTAPNTWYGLPVTTDEKVGVVNRKQQHIIKAIFAVSAEVDRRADLSAEAAETGSDSPEFEPILLLIDEWVKVYQSAGTKKVNGESEQERLIKALLNIVQRGLKQEGVRFILGTQNLFTGQCGLPQAMIQQLGFILLKKAATLPRNHQNLGLMDAEIKSALEEFKQIPESKRPCLVVDEEGVRVQIIPTLQVDDVQVETAPVVPWIEQVWTPDFEVLLAQTPNVSVSKAWGLVKVAGKGKQAISNPKYAAFQVRFNQFVEGN